MAITPGEIILASDVSTGLTNATADYIIKNADETVNNSATFQSDNDFAWSVGASTSYEFYLWLWYTSGTTPDIKLRWTAPTGAVINWSAIGTNITGVFSNPYLSALTEPGFAGSGGNDVVILTGLVTVSTTAGTLQLQWAQQTANASNTVVKAGSWGKLIKVT